MTTVCVGNNLVFIFDKGSSGSVVHLLVKLPPPSPPPTDEPYEALFKEIWQAHLIGRSHVYIYGLDGTMRNVVSFSLQGDPIAYCMDRLQNIGTVFEEGGCPDFPVDQGQINNQLEELRLHLKQLATA